MIPIFVGSSERFEEVEPVTICALMAHTDQDLQIHIVRPEWFGMVESGCTGFTNVRYAVPQLCRELGYDFGIYLDVDMLVLDNIAELYEYRQKYHTVVLQDGSDEVSIWCSTLKYPDKSVIHKTNKAVMPRSNYVRSIPLIWNVEDRVEPGMKLLHFTDLKAQPWFHNHPNQEVTAKWEEWRERADNWYWPESYAGSHRTLQ